MKGKRPRYVFSLKSVLLMSMVMALFTGVNLREQEVHGYLHWNAMQPTGTQSRSMEDHGRTGVVVVDWGWPLVIRRSVRIEAPIELSSFDLGVQTWTSLPEDLQVSTSLPGDLDDYIFSCLPVRGTIAGKSVAMNALLGIGISALAAGLLEWRLRRRRRRMKGAVGMVARGAERGL